MATRDRDWPGYTVWFFCPGCERLWTYQGPDVVALDRNMALGPAVVSEGIHSRTCVNCDGSKKATAAEI